MGEILFVTGTDTDIGKTVISAALCEGLRCMGWKVYACKPFASGSRRDARILHGAIAGELSLDRINPHFYPDPSTPLLAARRARRKPVPLGGVLGHLRELASQCDVLVVEGAGGLMSPLGEDYAAAEIIKALECRTILVTGTRLGVLSQTRCALEVLEHRKIAKQIAVIFNEGLGQARQKPDWWKLVSQTLGNQYIVRFRSSRLERVRATKSGECVGLPENFTQKPLAQWGEFLYSCSRSLRATQAARVANLKAGQDRKQTSVRSKIRSSKKR